MRSTVCLEDVKLLENMRLCIKIKNEFMINWDGLRTTDKERVLVLAATNRPFDPDETVIRRLPRRYFLAEIEELEQKSNSKTEKALQMLSKSDLLALGRAFQELQKSKWSALNGYKKLTSRAFHQCIIVYNLLRIERPKTGV
ncbi:uncharacterized protein [Arachis hypogaea]|uniref:uncharacterized protein n=1 Tax=Arachis hypogaea TaxID=3818 RepID=UPI003B21E42D|nr:uncharacterized protein DS421_1g14840 [Arachis hypogaea]